MLNSYGVKWLAFVMGVLIILAAVVTIPIAWLDGSAKAAYLKQTQGVDIPWYQAAWLEVIVNQQNVNVKPEQR
jgi:hypothetical protein